MDRQSEIPRFDPRFSVIDEGDGFIVVDKPAPLQVHPSVPGGPPTLLDGLRELLAFEVANGATLSIINRLDRETSGVVIVAKERGVARALHTAIGERRVEKEYEALVWGWPEDDSWDCELPVRRRGEVVGAEAAPVWVEQCTDPGGTPARTGFEVVERFRAVTSNGGEFARVRAVPETGRMHQIRVHLAAAGHPVVGDKIYGRPGRWCYLDFIETGWTPELARRLVLPRQALHCARMAVPGWGDWSAPWPDGLQLARGAAASAVPGNKTGAGGSTYPV